MVAISPPQFAHRPLMSIGASHASHDLTVQSCPSVFNGPRSFLQRRDSSSHIPQIRTSDGRLKVGKRGALPPLQPSHINSHLIGMIEIAGRFYEFNINGLLEMELNDFEQMMERTQIQTVTVSVPEWVFTNPQSQKPVILSFWLRRHQLSAKVTVSEKKNKQKKPKTNHKTTKKTTTTHT